MSDTAALRAIASSGLDRRARIFLILILLVTLAPHFTFVFREVLPAAPAWGDGLFLLASAHVALTGFLWFDGRYRQHIQAHPLFFYVFPLLLTITLVTAVYVSGERGMKVFMVAFFAWLLHHFGRQNWGVLCLFAAGTKSGPPSGLERQICRWAPVAAFGYALGCDLRETIPAPADALAAVSLAAGVILAAVATVLGLRQFAKGMHPLRVLATAATGLFFVPIYLSPTAGVIPVGIAHGYQYALIVGYLASSRHEGSMRLWVLPLVALTVIWFLMNVYITVGGPNQLVFILFHCVAIWHFLIDSDVWRLSRPFQRQAVRESFPFLFR